ncbi:hypothetical protein C7999DRAFT_13588 [Corynascus novoguineensis]|uniref:Uncharacterized protein n=1 Tax=Corynascus novoguineensis TaxID=1126955 RepID=A0AAN7HRI3_9PEZI|nr:hypothetical protein C7999DRAFT_13588 [Corynascus novoguineensis]
MTAPEVSHGRGGAGNINPDDTKYVDGEVVRAGAEGSHGDGAFSTGRGGAANIGDAGKKQAARLDADLVPEAAVRPSPDNADYHVGRGGAGNERHVAKKPEAEAAATGGGGGGTGGGEQRLTVPVGLADKLKKKLFSAFAKN